MDHNISSAYESLERTVASQRDVIDELKKQNDQLKIQVDKLNKQLGIKKNTPVKPSIEIRVGTGPSRANAAAALASKLGAKAPRVDSGPSRANAASLLAGKLGAKGGGGKAGVESGPSRANAAALLGGALGKRKPALTPASPTVSGEDDMSPGSVAAEPDLNRIFKKYEMMLKLGISIHGAIGRMVQDGIDKDIVRAFKAKHADKLDEQKEESVNLDELGLKPPRKIKVGGNLKLKRFHWEPIHPTKVPTTFWKQIDDSSVRYNPQHFELNFQVRERKPRPPDSKSERKANEHEIQTFVPKKRTQDVLIGLKSLGLNLVQIRIGLLKMDDKVITQSKLLTLMDIAPTQDEQTQAEKEIIKNGDGNPLRFGKAEQFFYALCDFYRLEDRLTMWLFASTFDDIHQTLLDSFKILAKACDKVKNDKNLKRLLTIILAFGNHMNANTGKGGAFGFHLKALTLLPGIRTFDNAKTLTMYIYQFCDKNYPDVLEVLEILGPVLKRCRSMESDTLNKAFQRMRDSVKDIQNIIESDDVDNFDMDDRFCPVMIQFHKKAKPMINKFLMTVTNVENASKRIMKLFYFGTDEGTAVIEDLFKILHDFIHAMERAKDALIKLEKERQKKLMKKKRAHKQKQAQQQKQEKQQHLKNATKAHDRRGSALEEAARQQLAHEEQMSSVKYGLKKHVRKMSNFVKRGGALEDSQSSSETLRRVSSLYQENLEEMQEIEDARRKVASKYNRPLPSLPDSSAMVPGSQRYPSPSSSFHQQRPALNPMVHSGPSPTTSRPSSQSHGGHRDHNRHRSKHHGHDDERHNLRPRSRTDRDDSNPSKPLPPTPPNNHHSSGGGGGGHSSGRHHSSSRHKHERRKGH